MEIGVVLKKNSRLYLAITKEKLLTVSQGQIAIIHPRDLSSYAAVPVISVENLCQRWRISIDTLDQISLQTFGIPKPSLIRIPLSMITGRRSSQKLQNEQWQNKRLCRTSAF